MKRYKAPISLSNWWQILRWQIAKDTGWKLEYIEGLNLDELWEYLSIEDGIAKFSESLARSRLRKRRNR